MWQARCHIKKVFEENNHLIASESLKDGGSGSQISGAAGRSGLSPHPMRDERSETFSLITPYIYVWLTFSGFAHEKFQFLENSLPHFVNRTFWNAVLSGKYAL